MTKNSLLDVQAALALVRLRRSCKREALSHQWARLVLQFAPALRSHDFSPFQGRRLLCAVVEALLATGAEEAVMFEVFRYVDFAGSCGFSCLQRFLPALAPEDVADAHAGFAKKIEKMIF